MFACFKDINIFCSLHIGDLETNLCSTSELKGCRFWVFSDILFGFNCKHTQQIAYFSHAFILLGLPTKHILGYIYTYIYILRHLF